MLKRNMEDYIMSEYMTADHTRPNLNKKKYPWRQSVNILTHFHQDYLNYALLKKIKIKETEPLIYLEEHWLLMWRVHKLEAKQNEVGERSGQSSYTEETAEVNEKRFRYSTINNCDTTISQENSFPGLVLFCFLLIPSFVRETGLQLVYEAITLPMLPP